MFHPAKTLHGQTAAAPLLGTLLDEWERLLGKGHPPRRAAARLGTSLPCVRALSATVQQSAR